MSTEDQTIEKEQGTQNQMTTVDQVREELSGGFTRADSLEELRQKSPPPQTKENEDEATPPDSIGLSEKKAESSSDDASEEREGEDEASSPDPEGKSKTEKPDEEGEEGKEKEDEPDDSPFTTITDDEETEDEEIEDEVPEIDFEEISEKVGYEINSRDELISLIRELDQKDPLEGLSPLLRQAAKFEQNGGNVKEYFNVLSVDTEQLGDKDVMWHKFKQENSQLAQEKPDFAREKFEREFNSKYRILSENKEIDDFDSDDEYNQWVKDRDYMKNNLEYEADKARKAIESEREKVLKDNPSKADMNQQVDDEIIQRYETDSKFYKENFESLQVPIDPEGKTYYNIGLNDASRPLFEKWLDNPSEFLQHLGFNPDKSIDAEALAQNIALVAAFSVDGENSVGHQFSKAMQERLAKDTVEKRLENPDPEGGRSGSGGQGSGNQVQEAIEALRDDVMKSRRR